MQTDLKNREELDIDVVNLTKTYNSNGKKVNVFEDFSFSVQRGKLIALVGPSVVSHK